MVQTRCVVVCVIFVFTLILEEGRSYASEHAGPTGKMFTTSQGMKMIEIKAHHFDAWTPSFADYRKAVEEVSGGLERPPIPHRVQLPGNFYLAEFPVTNQMYRQFVNETGHRPPSGEVLDLDRIKIGKGFSGIIQVSEGISAWDREGFASDDQPVAGVNYMDAVAFCKWLSKKEGRTYRLPEVYEWEFACRAGTNTLFWWGDRADVRHMNYAASRVGHPTPVGLYPPNPWGFYDMHGNVSECCEQIGRPGGVQKGGGWNYPGGLLGADVYVDVRGTFTPHMPITRETLEIGFRLACDISEAALHPSGQTAPTIESAGGKGPTIPELDITVGKRMEFGLMRGGDANVAHFLVTRGGTWILNYKRSTDQGKTWQECPRLGEAHCQLRDGTIIGVHSNDSLPGLRYPVIPDPLTGKTTVQMAVSTDDWQTVELIESTLHMPLVKMFNPVRGLIELPDGSLLMTGYGWNHGDQVRENNPMFPIVDQAYKTRVTVVRSIDRGRNWYYYSTIFNDPEKGREGANESTLIQLPNGDLFAAMRTGLHGYVDKLGRASLDEPLLVTWSRSGGKSWAEPERIYINGKLVSGIWPASVVTESGVLAVLRCRPDNSVIFSPDGSGAIWTDEVTYVTFEQAHTNPGGYPRGMNDIELIAPDTIMIATCMVPESGHAGMSPSEKEYIWVGIPITVKKTP